MIHINEITKEEADCLRAKSRPEMIQTVDVTDTVSFEGGVPVKRTVSHVVNYYYLVASVEY